MKWLSRIEVDAQTAFTSGMHDAYSWHQKAWGCFPGRPDGKRDFLTRLDTMEGIFRLWILSSEKPICPEWCRPEDYSIKEIAPTFLSHSYYFFDVRANPTKCIKCPGLKQNIAKRGKRVVLTSKDDLLNWITRKGTDGGFKISDEKPLEIGPVEENYFRKEGKSGFVGGVQYRGILEVTDTAKFQETYAKGIGRAKGFGFGLLLLSPVHE